MRVVFVLIKAIVFITHCASDNCEAKEKAGFLSLMQNGFIHYSVILQLTEDLMF